MPKRMEALWRVVAFLWGLVAAFIAQFVLLGAIIWGIIDVLWQLILGSDGLTAMSGIGAWLKRGVMWPVDLFVFALFGDGEFQLLP